MRAIPIVRFFLFQLPYNAHYRGITASGGNAARMRITEQRGMISDIHRISVIILSSVIATSAIGNLYIHIQFMHACEI